MITNLCNIVPDFNMDTFYKIRIILASELPSFNHLVTNDDILEILNNLPDTVPAMDIPLLPEKYNVKNDSKIRNGNKSFDTKITFTISPQDAAIKNLLETYNNRYVVAFIIRRTYSYLYGTPAQPLLFTYDELHANNPAGLKGFSIDLDGEGYGAAKYFEGNEDQILSNIPFLAFELSGPL